MGVPGGWAFFNERGTTVALEGGSNSALELKTQELKLHQDRAFLSCRYPSLEVSVRVTCFLKLEILLNRKYSSPLFEPHLPGLGGDWSPGAEFISHKVVLTSIFKSRFPHKSVNLFFILVIVKDKLTDLWGS